MYCPEVGSYRNRFPVSAAEVESASVTVPAMPLLTLAKESLTTAFVIDALSPVRVNFTGTVRPSLKIDDPSLLMGCNRPDQLKVTRTVKLSLAEFPCESVALHVTVVT